MRITPARNVPHASILGFVTSLGLNACTGSEVQDVEIEHQAEDDGSSSDGSSEDGPMIICEPGELRCADATTLETCAPTGLNWESRVCGSHEVCDGCFGDECVAACVGPCQWIEASPSSEGCSFYATSLLRNGSGPDAIVVANPDPELTATVNLWFVPWGSNQEELAQGPVELPPGESRVLLLESDAPIAHYSMYRSGFVHHLASDLPVTAYFHSPLDSSETNASTLLFPEHVLTGNYVVYATEPTGAPSYFSVIALEHQTTVRWWPTVETAGNGVPLPFVERGEMGEQRLNRFDNIRIDSSSNYGLLSCQQDLSGTVISADKPISVVSAVFVAHAPACQPTSPADFIMEQNLPVEYWGTEYVGPHAPLRGNEPHFWRVYAGDNSITITVDPPQPGTPIHLAKRGDWAELVLPAGTSLLFSGDGPFMPVQYVASDSDGDIGAPAMTQMVPTAQFLDEYIFATGSSYNQHYVQVIRELQGAEVTLDGGLVDEWTPLGAWEYATVEIAEGAHTIASEDGFGIVQYGYSEVSGYAYAGGMKAEPHFVP